MPNLGKHGVGLSKKSVGLLNAKNTLPFLDTCKTFYISAAAIAYTNFFTENYICMYESTTIKVYDRKGIFVKNITTLIGANITNGLPVSFCEVGGYLFFGNANVFNGYKISDWSIFNATNIVTAYSVIQLFKVDDITLGMIFKDSHIEYYNIISKTVTKTITALDTTNLDGYSSHTKSDNGTEILLGSNGNFAFYFNKISEVTKKVTCYAQYGCGIYNGRIYAMDTNGTSVVSFDINTLAKTTHITLSTGPNAYFVSPKQKAVIIQYGNVYDVYSLVDFTKLFSINTQFPNLQSVYCCYDDNKSDLIMRVNDSANTSTFYARLFKTAISEG